MKYLDFRHHSRVEPVSQASWKRVLFHPFVLSLWVIGCLALSFTLLRSMIQIHTNLGLLPQAKQRVQQQEQQGLQLVRQLQEADSPLSQEKIIRDELGLQKPGETVLQLPSPLP